MKRAKVYATAFQVHCPECSEPCAEPGGSLMWEAEQLAPGAQLQCYSCQTIFQLPTRVPAHA